MLDQTPRKSHKVGQEGLTESHLLIYAKFQKEHFLEVRAFAPFCTHVRFRALVVRPTLWGPKPQKKIESIKDFWNLFPWGLFHLVP